MPENEEAHMAVDAIIGITVSFMGQQMTLPLEEARALFNELGRALRFVDPAVPSDPLAEPKE